MRQTLEFTWILLAVAAGLRAQAVQNMDIFYMAGPISTSSQVIPGSTLTVSGSTGLSTQIGYGYMVSRVSAASLWIEFAPMTFTHPGASHSDLTGSATLRMWTFAPSVRFMVPVQTRVSLYGLIGGGFGSFRYPSIAGGSNPYLTSNATTHGVFTFGGGVDLRIVRRVSLRGEVRDFVTGSGLSGRNGIHHPVPLGGLALHF